MCRAFLYIPPSIFSRFCVKSSPALCYYRRKTEELQKGSYLRLRDSLCGAQAEELRTVRAERRRQTGGGDAAAWVDITVHLINNAAKARSVSQRTVTRQRARGGPPRLIPRNRLCIPSGLLCATYPGHRGSSLL
ncbi:hypothetical protein CRENBAI_008043 [Crenichthys baileyi]|uniref:Uncharacterized protein n=1 Tax=Crenichthys baileyi TaxID=28760 RepID=A0AAV9QP21_9TELE